MAVAAWGPHGMAFPPLPHHTVYGLVRDELGTPLTAAGGEITLETLSGTTLKTVVAPGAGAGVNYRIEVPIDAGLTTDAYLPTAMQPTAPFRMKVKLGTRTFVPMEMKVDWARLGQPAEQSRVDLTLGEDTDGDGLPDAWERMMIQSGKLALSLAQFTPTNRLNGNALTVMESYVAGTYAWDPKDGFRLDILSMDGPRPVLQFTALRGRSYTITGSDDLRDWRPVTFGVQGGTGRPMSFLTTNQLSRVRVVVPEGQGEAAPKFYRLHVN
jgi:hypothetical protein